MALYDLNDEEVMNIKTLLDGISMQGNRKQRKELDKNLDSIFDKLAKPIHPAGKPKGNPDK